MDLTPMHEKLKLIADEVEDEVRDTLEICRFVNELRCWDELSDEALVEFEKLIDEFAPPITFCDKLRYWTFDDWKDWLMGKWEGEERNE